MTSSIYIIYEFHDEYFIDTLKSSQIIIIRYINEHNNTYL